MWGRKASGSPLARTSPAWGRCRTIVDGASGRGDGGAEGPVEAGVVDLDEEAVDPGAELDGDGVGAGGVGAAGLVGVDELAVEPDPHAVVAADAEHGLAGGRGRDLGVAVGDAPL